MARIGDVYEIGLDNGKFAYAQYVYKDQRLGPIVRVFDHISQEPLQNISALLKTNLLFPPIIVGIGAAEKYKLWRKVGKLPSGDFVFTNFINTFWDPKSGEAGVWFLWEKDEKKEIGRTLLNEYKDLEFLVVWHPNKVKKRIETGKIAYPFGELIQHNKFELKS